MAKADLEDAAEVRRLHDVLRQRHAELRAAEAGSPEYARLRALTLEATDDLVRQEEELPRRRDERRRRTNTLIRYAVCGVAGLAAVAAIVLMVVGEIGWWYLVPALVVLLMAAIGIAAGSASGSGEAP